MGRTLRAAGQSLEVLFDLGTLGSWTDGRLLDRFLETSRDEAEVAFEVLVARHGSMVLSVCRRILRDEHQAQDAAQAVFLVLARRACIVRRRDSAAGWLYRVARRTATRLRKASIRRREVAWNGTAEITAMEGDTTESAEIRDGLHQELDRLPERYRTALVLCCLQGLTCQEASQRLECRPRTIETRLHRGRNKLREALIRRGLAPSVVLAEAARDASAASPRAWAASTIRAAVEFTSHPASVAASSTTTHHLALGVLCMMSMRRFLSTACPLGLLGVTAACGLWARSLAEAAERPPTPPPASAAKQPPKDTAPKELAEDDGKASGRRSIAGGGHAVRFTAPDDTATLKQVKVHGSRYGLPRPPREDFVVFVCDEKFQKLAEFPFRYERFERGEPRWVTLDVKPFRLPRTFYIGLDFDPTQTKGVYVSHDGSRPGKSVVGLPGERVEPFEKGNWMIRAVVADH